MKKIVSMAIIALTLIGSVAPSSAAGTNQVVNDLNTFAFELYHQLQTPDQNVIVSPYSLSSLLSLLVSGAAENTRTQLIHLLHLENISNIDQINISLETLNAALDMANQCQGWMGCHFNKLTKQLGMKQTKNILIANALWADNKFTYLPSYLASIKSNHAINFYRVDFTNNPEKARIKINDWVENNTSGYIQNLIPEGAVTPITRLILTNAIYFKGLWQLPFKSDMTQQQAFTLQTGSKVQVPMMHQQDKFAYTENTDLQLLQLPYANSTLAMAILLPKANHSLQEIQQQLNSSTFSQLLQSVSRQKVNVNMPRFKLASTFNSLSKTMQALGLTDAFNDKANFSNMSNSTLFISDIIQKAMVQVDETGTVAAAATGVLMSATSIIQESPPIEFNADHPFLFFIYDTQSNVILFMGQVTNPG